MHSDTLGSIQQSNLQLKINVCLELREEREQLIGESVFDYTVYSTKPEDRIYASNNVKEPSGCILIGLNWRDTNEEACYPVYYDYKENHTYSC